MNRPTALVLLPLGAAILASTLGCEITIKNDPDSDSTALPEECFDGVGATAPEVLSCGAFAEARTLINHPDRSVDYVIDCRDTIREPLTIEGGAVLQFSESSGLIVDGDGSLTAAGDLCGPVVFEGVDGGPWNGLMFYSESEENRLDDVVVRGAGAESFNSNGDLGAIILWASARLTLLNSTISGSASTGVNAVYGGASLTFESNTIEDSAGPPLLLLPEYASSLDADSALADNDEGYVSLKQGTIESDASWQALSVPYQVQADAEVQVRGTATLTLEPGAEVYFDTQAALEILDTASLDAAGSPNERVILAGAEAISGHWRGLYIDSTETQNRLQSVDLLDAGGGAFNSNGDLGAIVLWASSDLSLEDTTVANSDSHAVTAIYNQSTLSLAGNTFTDNRAAPLRLAPYLAAEMDSASSYAGNDVDAVLVQSGAIVGAQSWAPLDVPYQLTTADGIFFEVVVEEGDVLTLEAGVAVEAERDCGFEAYGDFHVDGTAEAPVSLTGVEATPGYWKGLFFDAPNDERGSFTVDHATIAHAGSGAFNSNGDIGAVIVWASTDASVTNTTFYDNAGECQINAPYSDTNLNVGGTTGAVVCDED